MKIAIIGYGKMGKTIEKIAESRGHEVLLRIKYENKDELEKLKDYDVDVAIEFSQPEAAFDNLAACFQADVPVICGTTGWLDRLEEAQEMCRQYKGAFFYASNFSIGVNLFFELNKYLATMMEDYPEYEVKMEEIHHTQKKDAPSGTAITLAQQILDVLSRKEKWVKHPAHNPSELPIKSKREGSVPGTHTIGYHSEIDSIEIKHTAHSREGFAIGAVMAAEWIIGKYGYFEMKDMMGF